VASVSVEPRVARELLERFGVDADRLFVTPEVGRAPPEPDVAVNVARAPLEVGARLREFGLELAPRLG
jgi:hypothetical protein